MGSIMYKIDHASALTIFGNEFLRAGKNASSPSPSYNFHPTLRFSVSDDTESVGLICADTPSVWFSKLHENGIEGLRLRRIPEPGDRFPHRDIAVSLGPGRGRWFIEAVGGSDSEYWESSWWFEGAKYSLVKIDRSVLDPLSGDLRELGIQLENALVDISAYAKSKGLGHFVPCFSSAIEYLHSDEPPTRVIYTDFDWDLASCEVLPLDARRLIASARSAWGVFGTMGAWNDRSKGERTDEYLDVTEKLSIRLTDAMVAATNSSFGTKQLGD